MPPTSNGLCAGLYARVSSSGDRQTTLNQLLELREYAGRQGWVTTEYIDEGISGTKASRPSPSAWSRRP